VRAASPDRDVRASIFYTATGEHVDIDPLSLDELRAVIRERDRDR